MSVLPAEELAVAGHAVALASWHQVSFFGNLHLAGTRTLTGWLVSWRRRGERREEREGMRRRLTAGTSAAAASSGNVSLPYPSNFSGADQCLLRPLRGADGGDRGRCQAAMHFRGAAPRLPTH